MADQPRVVNGAADLLAALDRSFRAPALYPPKYLEEKFSGVGLGRRTGRETLSYRATSAFYLMQHNFKRLRSYPKLCAKRVVECEDGDQYHCHAPH